MPEMKIYSGSQTQRIVLNQSPIMTSTKAIE